MNWLFLTPRRYYLGYSWLGRDLGLACTGMRELGVHASFACYRAEGIPESPPFLPVEPADVASGTWWKQSGFTHVFALTSARREFEPILRAAKTAGVFVFVRMDSDGWQSPRQGFIRYCSDMARSNRDSGLRMPYLKAFAKSIAFRLLPQISDNIWLRQFELSDAICIESTVAGTRLEQYFKLMRRNDLAERICIVPGPIPAEFDLRSEIPKRNRIIAVGRWRYLQKNPELLASTLVDFLGKHPDWDAVVIGNGEEKLERLLASHRNRIRITGRIDRSCLPSEFAAARIALSTSFADGFPNALGEAVCSGCSVVAPSHISSSKYFCSYGSGTVYEGLLSKSAVSALEVEANAWSVGLRSPKAISESFRKKLNPGAVANSLLQKAERRDFIS